MARWAVVVVALVASAGTVGLLAEVGRMLGPAETLASEPASPWVYATMGTYFGVYVFVTMFTFLLFIGWRTLPGPRKPAHGDFPFVSVIIPAFNEETDIARSIAAALALDYPSYEVIVVDDGSRDFSLRLAGGAAVSLLRLRRNQGKAAALNAGIDNAKGDIIVFTDSDSRLSPSSLRHLVGWFARPTVGAVAGRVVLSAHRTWLARWQSIEYLFGQQVQKLAQAGSGSSITVCPGPVCAFRRDALIGLGGVKARTLVEDFDLTLEAVSAGWEVIYEPRAQAWTRAPDTLRELLRQRVRWSRGTLQTLREHRRLILSPATGALGMFWLPYYLVIGFGGVLFELVVLLTLPFLVAASGAPLHTLGVGLAYLLLVESLVAAQYLFVLLLEGGEARRLAPAALLMKPYHLVLAWTRLVAMVREYRGDPHRWSA